ncbi:MAG: DUF6036 family nucleotidyltransferase, partial [Candidatus Methanospirareceae archaeon]
KEVEAYLIGGLALILHGAKLATKDVDIVFDSYKNLQVFVNAMETIGFSRVKELTGAYQNLEAHSVLEAPNGCRFDIFLNKICNCLILSEGMKNRSKEVFSSVNLKLFTISPEDIFLFKSITNRPDDLADMAIIAGSGLDWNIIEEELKNQPEYWKWVPHYFRSLVELEEEYSIISPSKKKLQKEAEISMGIGVILDRLKEQPYSFDDIVKILDADDLIFSRDIVEKMKKLGLVKEKDGLYYLT